MENTSNAAESRGFIAIFTDFFNEFIDFIVYIFYGVLRGENT